MDIRLAISDNPRHKRRWEGRWLEYCRERGIPHERADCSASDVIVCLKGVDGSLWHINFQIPTDLFMARHVLRAAGQMGLAVFPNDAT